MKKKNEFGGLRGARDSHLSFSLFAASAGTIKRRKYQNELR